MLYVEDFNVLLLNDYRYFVQIEELNKLIKYGAIIVNREKLEEYKKETRVRNFDR